MMYDASNRKDIRKAEKEARAAERERHDFIRSIMDQTTGREWILSLLERSHIFHTSFTGEALRSAFNEGERNIGIFILSDIMRCCPDKYMLMMQERNEKDAGRDATGEPSGSEDTDRGDQGSEQYNLPIDEYISRYTVGREPVNASDGFYRETESPQ